jgi:PAS domain S-box-containing protein
MAKTAKKIPVKKKRSEPQNVVSEPDKTRVQYALLKSILDHVADPVFVKDRQHRIIYGNRALSEMIGLPPSKYLGKDDYEFFPKEEADVFWKKDNKVFETGEVDLNEEHLTDSNGRHHIISTKKTLCTVAGHEPVIVGITRDVTAFKEIERLKNEFIAMISHELRTPLTSIHASLALLASGKVCDLPPETDVIMQIAYKNSERLVRLVNEILDIEKIEAGMLRPEIRPIPVDHFLVQAIAENSAYGHKYGIAFELEGAPKNCYVMADVNRLMQVLANLLSNAAKFSKRGASVHLSATVSPKGRVCFQIRDFGAGIPEKFHSTIFDKFSQGDTSSTRRHSGSGLGLNISKKLVEVMGGEIYFRSKMGEGTTFYVELHVA